MLHIVMMFMLTLSVMASASVKSSITSLKLAYNYTSAVRQLYYEEGIVSFALHALKDGQDRNGDGTEDFQEVHGNGTVVWYTYDGTQVTVSRSPDDPHLAIIQAGRVTITVNNFPGGGQSCLNNNQCTPELVAWYAE